MTTRLAIRLTVALCLPMLAGVVLDGPRGLGYGILATLTALLAALVVTLVWLIGDFLGVSR